MSRWRWLVARGCMLVLLAWAGLARAETLVIAGDIWCPVNCQPGSERPGILVELAQEIFAEAGIEVQYKALNWARTLQMVRRGELNAAVGAGVEDAPDFLYGATPVASSRSCFFTRQDSTWRFTGTASLALNIGKLMHGRVDVVLENAWVMQAMQAMLATQGRVGELREAGCRAPDVPIYLAFSPVLESSPRYVALFEQGLQRYRANGRLQALLAAYGVQTP